jgi:hypothetical protein
MIAILYYIMGCYGLTTILVQSKIFKPVRESFKESVPFIHSLLTCMMCTGFWVGVLITILFRFSISYQLFSTNGTNVFELLSYVIFDGAFTSGMMWLMFLVQLNLERHVKDEI